MSQLTSVSAGASIRRDERRAAATQAPERRRSGGRRIFPGRFQRPTAEPAGAVPASWPLGATVASTTATLPWVLPVRRLAYAAAKRALDVAVSAGLIVLLSPVLAAIAAIIKWQDGGPVFYRHMRVGRGGREFPCFKFRSMAVDAERVMSQLRERNDHADGRTFKMANDPRITAFGRLLRRSSLDELPQLLNVLRGEMSLVGPRPPLPSEVAQYSPTDMKRLAVKPGITCIWQVSGRSKLPFPEQLRLDLQYIQQQSLLLDLKLLARTVPAVLSADGAY
jgi:lipopolysaccharide/colanic/teichoic acid biosynthesis glycosyltransferase